MTEEHDHDARREAIRQALAMGPPLAEVQERFGVSAEEAYELLADWVRRDRPILVLAVARWEQRARALGWEPETSGR